MSSLAVIAVAAVLICVALAGSAWVVSGDRALPTRFTDLLDPPPPPPPPPSRWCPQCEGPLNVVRTEGGSFVYMCDTCVNAWPADWAALLTEEGLRQRVEGRAAVEAEKQRLRDEQAIAAKSRRRAALAPRAKAADREKDEAVGCSAAAVRTRQVDIHHHGRLDLRFRVHGLADRDFERCRRLAVRYEKDPRTRVQLPAAPDAELYRDSVIYAATVVEDRPLWDDAARADQLDSHPGPLLVEALLDAEERAWVLGVIEELSRQMAPGARSG